MMLRLYHIAVHDDGCFVDLLHFLQQVIQFSLQISHRHVHIDYPGFPSPASGIFDSQQYQNIRQQLPEPLAVLNGDIERLSFIVVFQLGKDFCDLVAYHIGPGLVLFLLLSEKSDLFHLLNPPQLFHKSVRKYQACRGTVHL